MNTVLKHDRVILTKELNDKIKNVGDTFEIANVLDNAFLLREAKTKIVVGVISFEDFEKHFVHEESFNGWTPWTQLVGCCGQTDAFYRTNRKKTQVKFLTDKVKGESCKHIEDDFNLFFGIQVAYLRCCNKSLEKQKVKYENNVNCEEKIKQINHEIAENKTILKKMINSLE